jgi:hypothetical protein
MWECDCARGPVGSGQGGGWRCLWSEERSTLRAWLYRVATNRCLNALRAARRRPAMDWSVPDVEPPEPSRLGEVVWLEPYPDTLLEGLVDTGPGPEARYELTEAISLAFVTALQLLPSPAAGSPDLARRARLPRRGGRRDTRYNRRVGDERPQTGTRLPSPLPDEPGSCSFGRLASRARTGVATSAGSSDRGRRGPHHPADRRRRDIHAARSARISRPRARRPIRRGGYVPAWPHLRPGADPGQRPAGPLGAHHALWSTADQILDGIGVTWEHPAHMYFRRAKSAQLVFGDSDHHRAY